MVGKDAQPQRWEQQMKRQQTHVERSEEGKMTTLMEPQTNLGDQARTILHKEEEKIPSDVPLCTSYGNTVHRYSAVGLSHMSLKDKEWTEKTTPSPTRIRSMWE